MVTTGLFWSAKMKALVLEHLPNYYTSKRQSHLKATLPSWSMAMKVTLSIQDMIYLSSNMKIYKHHPQLRARPWIKKR
eukprot:scaffold281781_cov24-Attheya_sp.AAC.1